MENETRFCTQFPPFAHFFDFQTQKKAIPFMVTLFNNVEISISVSCVPAIIGNCSCYFVRQGTDRHCVILAS